MEKPDIEAIEKHYKTMHEDYGYITGTDMKALNRLISYCRELESDRRLLQIALDESWDDNSRLEQTLEKKHQPKGE